MDLTPGEKTVLAQIRVLYRTGGREQLVKALMAQWPPSHFQTYQFAYAGLVEKRLVEEKSAQAFTITEAGLRAIGVTPAKPRIPVPRAPQQPPVVQPAPQPVAEKPRGSALSRLVKGLLSARS